MFSIRPESLVIVQECPVKKSFMVIHFFFFIHLKDILTQNTLKQKELNNKISHMEGGT